MLRLQFITAAVKSAADAVNARICLAFAIIVKLAEKACK
jgi:hypothetical protein